MATGPGTAAPSALALSRRLDWRFLLPGAGLGRVAVVGEPDVLLGPALAAGTDVSLVEGGDPGEASCDVVICCGLPAQQRARSLVAPGGHLYVEAGSRRSGGRAATDLLAGGFQSVAQHAHLPRMTAPTEIFPLRHVGAARYAVGRHGGRSVRTRAAGIVVRASPAALPGLPVSVVGRRPVTGDETPPPPGVLSVLDDDVLERLGRGPAGSWPATVLITPRYSTSRHVIAAVLGEGGRPQVVVKVPRLAGDSGAVEREARSIAALVDSGAPAQHLAPEVLAFPKVGDRRWLVETAVRGEPLGRRLLRADRRRSVASVVRWLGDLPVAGCTSPGDDGRHERLLLAPLRLLAEALAGTEDQALVPRTVEEVEPLRAASLPVVFEHGDLSHPNLVRQQDGRLVVVDWELAEPAGLPAQDLIFFLAFAAASVDRAADVPAQVRAFAAAVLTRGGWGREELELDAARLGYDPGLLRPLLIACWARQAAHLLVRTLGTAGPTPSREVVDHLRAGRLMAIWRDAVRSGSWC